MQKSKIKIVLIVDTGWQTASNGVATFLRVLNPDRQNRLDCAFVERPAGGREQGVSTDGKLQAGRQHHNRYFQLRLTLGYLQEVLRDMRFLWSVSSRLRGKVIVLNEFGCETLPIAARVVFPCHRIVAIAHTHPGMLGEARHPVRRAVEWLCCRCVSEVIFNSRALQESWRGKVRGLPGTQTVIHHGMPDASTVGLPVDYPVKKVDCVDFVCVSRFVYWKGHRQLLEAWKLALNQSRGMLRLILVGNGATFCEMQAYACELGLSNSVFFLGEKTNGADYFAGGDVGVQPSIEPESFGLVLLEAMSRGLPVLASKVGGIPEVVTDGETGLLVEPRDVEAMADAIVRLASDPALRKRMGDAGRVRARNVFSVEKMLEGYDRALQQGGRGKT